MLPQNFNLVLTGENFPVQSIMAANFEFNHEALRETARFPMGINAATRGASLQVRPDHIRAAVVEVRNIDSDAENLIKLIERIFDYVGPKSFKTAGHNAQFVLDSAIPKNAVKNIVLDTRAVARILDAEPAGADINLYRPIQSGAILRTSILTQTSFDPIMLDFNAHFELKSSSAHVALMSLRESLDTMVDIATRVENSLSQTGAGTVGIRRGHHRE